MRGFGLLLIASQVFAQTRGRSAAANREALLRHFNEDASHENTGGEEGVSPWAPSGEGGEDNSSERDFDALASRVAASSSASVSSEDKDPNNAAEDTGKHAAKCSANDNALYSRYRDLLELNYAGAFDGVALHDLVGHAAELARELNATQQARASSLALPAVEKKSAFKTMHSYRYYLDDFKSNLKQLSMDALFGFDVIFAHARLQASDILASYKQQSIPVSSQVVQNYLHVIADLEKEHDALIDAVSKANRVQVRRVASWHQARILDVTLPAVPSALDYPLLGTLDLDPCE